MVKCLNCNKRTHITFDCKCGLQTLCITCKSAELHDCKFDYKEEHKIKLKKENPQIIQDKIIKL